MSGFESRYKIGRPRGALMMLMSVGLLIAVIMQAALAAKPVVIGTNYCPERLPINVEPQEYNIELTLLNKFSAVKGKVDIFVHFASVEFKKSKNLLTDLFNKISPVSTKPERGSIKDQNNREPTDFIALHMSRHFKILDLELKSASTIDELHESHGQPVSIDNTIEHHRNCEIIKIRLAGETPRLPLGLFGLISIKYESSELPGLYSGAIYDINSGSDRLYHAVHLGKPGEARHLIPCFDELNLKAKIALSVIQPDLESRVLSNMPAEIENESIKIGDRVLYKTKFQQTDRAIPIGSLAFAIGPYKHANGSPRHTRKSVRVGLFEPSGHSNEGNFALDFATKTMIWFLDELKFDRPTVDINLVAVPSLSWNGDPVFDGLGIGLIDLKYLLIDEKLSSPERKIEAALNVALVLARQWFGNVLVPKSNRDLWITEGLAFHLAIRAVRHLRPDFQVDEYVKTHHSWRVLVRYNRNRSKPMHPKSVATDDLVKQVEGEHLIDLFRANIVRDQTRFDRILRGLISGEKESLIGGIDKFTLVEEFKQINFSNEKLSKLITVMMQENAFTPLNVNVLRNTNDHHIKNVVIEYPNRLFYFWQTLRIRVEFACTGPASAELQEKKEVHLHELNWHQRTYEIKPPTWFSWPKQDDNNDPNGCWFHAILGDDAETDQLLPYYLVIYREEEIIRHMGKAIRANNKLLSKRDKIDLLRQLTIEMQEGHTWVKLDETIRYYENERDPDVLLEVLRAIWVHCNYQRRSSRSVELEDFKEQLRTYYDHIGGINKVTGDESMSEQRLKSMLALMLIEANDQQVIQDAKDAFDSIGPDKLAAFQRDPVYRVLSRIDVDDTRGKSLMTRLNLVSLEEERDRIRGRNGLNCESI